MWRALVFLGLLCVAAFGAVWLADRPGTVLVTFGGYELQTSVAVATIALVALALALALLWAGITALLRLPSRLTFASRARRRARGYQAVSRGMVAVGAGDPIAARRYASEAERLLGREALTLLLKAQAAQVSGNRAAAEAAFTEMMDEDETRVLGLRGLFVEARRRGDADAAREYAGEAIRIAPAATWASDAVLEARCADRDWRGALESVERRASLGLLDKPTARRHRAVLLAADALDRAEHDPERALASAQDAARLAPGLVPAAALAGRLLSRKGDLRRAAKIIEAAWRIQPHPDLAEVYLNLRRGDSGLDRLKRAETLSRMSQGSAEGRLAVARAALESREFGRARDALEPLLAERPSMRVCLLMSDLEQAEHGATGRGREWLARATRAPRDPAWIADGIVSDQWAPISPVTGRLDAFVWQAPPDVLVAPELTMSDDVTADLDDEPRALPVADEATTVSPAPVEPVGGGAEPPSEAAPEPPKPKPQPVVFPAGPPDDPGLRDEPTTRRSFFG
ncbi:heme biosynthesis protein HemY [Microvirga brassicacearum]|uniref:Heme biosynthesis protein HemY n=1 Tax=Microvirga brassicacearum TaxID=2580413 RepID=A0A5N3P9M4_9HYPH|nr:heme biosynthesis HemY N-terminal domain-containing protein [Microvirga brassicacearum]KAB0266423.1 heme biosynthesis protein HemY [Microvirga brassicacearum]